MSSLLILFFIWGFWKKILILLDIIMIMLTIEWPVTAYSNKIIFRLVYAHNTRVILKPLQGLLVVSSLIRLAINKMIVTHIESMHRLGVGSTVVHRLQRWPNNKLTPNQHHWFAGPPSDPMHCITKCPNNISNQTLIFVTRFYWSLLKSALWVGRIVH